MQTSNMWCVRASESMKLPRGWPLTLTQGGKSCLPSCLPPRPPARLRAQTLHHVTNRCAFSDARLRAWRTSDAEPRPPPAARARARSADAPRARHRRFSRVPNHVKRDRRPRSCVGISPASAICIETTHIADNRRRDKYREQHFREQFAHT